MIAVADAFDAMTSDRPYRRSKPLVRAINTIKEVSGSQLCPKCVGLFLQWVEDRPILGVLNSESEESRRHGTSADSAQAACVYHLG